jgi:hypothetical protein
LTRARGRTIILQTLDVSAPLDMGEPDSSWVPVRAAPRGVALSRFFSQPLWPNSRLDRTTAAQVAFALSLVLAGALVYARGITYEGALLGYMASSIVIAQPYFLKEYRLRVPFLVLLLQLPRVIAAQVQGVSIGNWYYRPDAHYLLGRITADGQGPFKWTRLLYFGAEMPVMEYLYYPSQGYFQMTLMALFLSVLSPRLVKTERRWLGWGFYAFFSLFTLCFLWVYTLRVIDIPDGNWSIFRGPLVLTWLALIFSKTFRKLTRTPAMWLWILCMGCLFMPLWEFFHSCVDRDWIYVANHPMPPLYIFNGSPIPVVEPFGYVGVSILFPALLSLLRDFLGNWTLREPATVPLDTATQILHARRTSA